MFDSIVLNEASLPFESIDDCEKNLDSFFDILHKAQLKNVNFSRADEIEGNWNSIIYANDFNFGQWLNEISDRDRYRQIKSVLSTVKCPLVNLNDRAINRHEGEMLFVLSSDHNIEVLGLGLASLNSAHGLSLASQPHWMESFVTITKQWDEAGRIVEQDVNVPNICTIAQIEKFLIDLETKKQKNRNYFDDVQTEGNDDFPNLTFTKSVLKTFRSSSLSAIDYSKVLEVLNKLNKAIVRVNSLEELAEDTKLRITGESAETMGSKKLIRLRTFIHPVLSSTVFEDHVKNFPGAKRMHIFINYEQRNICIGYFGKHLKTISE